VTTRYKKSAPAPRFRIIVGFGLLLASGLLLAALFIENPEQKPVVTQVAELGVVDILVPVENIDVGAELKPTLFRKESREKTTLAGVNLISDFEQLRGVYAKSFIPAGQPLVTDHITSKPPINSVVPKIRQGYRAITVKLDRETTNEGWARAGVRVDVLLVADTGPKATGTIILQNVRVLSSGTSVSSEFGGESQMVEGDASTVTLEVSIEDQKRLKLASGQGTLRLLLRGDEDTGDIIETETVPLDSIIGLSDNVAAKGPSDQGWVLIDGRRYRVVGAALLPE
jgi:pilus assembly protein CpaB